MTPDVVLIAGANPVGVVVRSIRRPATLFADLELGFLTRGGVLIHPRRQAFQVILLLALRPGCIVSHDEMIEWLYGDREDGGPVHAMRGIWQAAIVAQRESRALGYHVENIHKRGFILSIPEPARAAA